MRVPARGGEPEPVSTNGPFDELRCAISGTRCVLRVAGKSQHVYYELDPQRGRGEELLRTPWIPAVLGDWDLSLDGSKIAIPNHDSKTAVIHVIRLDPDNNGPKQWDVPIPGLANLRGLHWAAGDHG